MSRQKTFPAYRKLAPRFRTFVDAIVSGKTGALAVLQIRPTLGRPDDLAYHWRQRPDVRAALAERLEAALEDAGINNVYVLRGAREVFERCMQGVQVLDREGAPTGEWKFDARGALGALDVMAKYLKMFGDVRPADSADADANKNEFEIARRLAYLLMNAAEKLPLAIPHQQH